jgi:small subunit ribosomal protein S15
LRLADTAWYNSREEERKIIVRGTQETGLDKAQKQAIIAEYRTHDEDTGSTETQIAVLTARINELTQHLRENKHDESTRRGLLQKVGRRRRLLRYLNGQNVAGYRSLIARLGLRR